MYDVSKWHTRHPGGVEVLLAYAGRDATDQFELFHPPAVSSKLSPFLTGTLDSSRAPAVPVRWGLTSKEEPDPTAAPLDPKDARGADLNEVDPATRDYRELRRTLWEEGAFEPQVYIYTTIYVILSE